MDLPANPLNDGESFEALDRLHHVIVAAAEGRATRAELEEALRDANALYASKLITQDD